MLLFTAFDLSIYPFVSLFEVLECLGLKVDQLDQFFLLLMKDTIDYITFNFDKLCLIDLSRKDSVALAPAPNRTFLKSEHFQTGLLFSSDDGATNHKVEALVLGFVLLSFPELHKDS